MFIHCFIILSDGNWRHQAHRRRDKHRGRPESDERRRFYGIISKQSCNIALIHTFNLHIKRDTLCCHGDW